MTLQERARAVLEGRKPDVVPWFTDLTYWHHGQGEAGTLPDRYRGAEGLLQLHRDLGVGVYLFTPPLVRADYDPDAFRWESTPIDDHRSRLTVTSPDGTLHGIEEHCSVSASTATLEWPVKTVDDLRVVRAWYEGARYVPNHEAFFECLDAWGDIGFGVPLTPRTPLATLAAQWSGVTNLTYIMAEAPDELEDTLEFMRRREDELYRLICEAPYPVVEIPDNLSAETMGGLWRTYSRDYYRERTAQLHAAGKKVGCHIDGTLGTLLKDIVDAGIDFPESVVPSPVGDLSLSEIRESVGPDTILWGGLPAAMFAPPFEAEQVLAFVRDVVRELGAEGRLVLAGADQVPPNGNIDLVRRVAELVEQLGPPA